MKRYQVTVNVNGKLTRMIYSASSVKAAQVIAKRLGSTVVVQHG